LPVAGGLEQAAGKWFSGDKAVKVHKGLGCHPRHLQLLPGDWQLFLFC